MYIERMVTEEQNTEKTRRQIHDREIQEEQEAKKRVKDDMMQALVREGLPWLEWSRLLL